MIKLIKINLKMMMGNRSFYILYGVTVMLMLLLVSQMFSVVKEGIQIPIGVVDLDHSSFSEFMLQRLSENPLLKVVKYDESDVEKKIKNQDVEAIYIIDSGSEQKVIKGETKQLLRMVFLDENYFALLLSDIVSGDILDEICLRIAADYYNTAMYSVDTHYISVNDNAVYLSGKQNLDKQDENYYVNIQFADDVQLKTYDSKEQNIVIEKMTLGISFILIAFFSLFIGIFQKNEINQSILNRLNVAGISTEQIFLSHLTSIIIGTLTMGLPLYLLLSFYGSNEQNVFIVILFYGINIACFTFLIGIILNKTSTYIIVGLSSIIGMGIISGSFFSIDVSNPIIFWIARSCPTFYSINVYFDKSQIWEYSIYTGVYLVVIIFIGLQLNYFKLRRQI